MRAPLVAAAGALGALALWLAVPGPVEGPAPDTAGPPRAAPAPPAPPAPDGRAASPPAAAPADGADDAAAPAHVARAVEAALDRHLAATGAADRLTPADRAALRDALLRARAASLRARRRGRDGAWQGEQSRALVAADRLFRDKLGTGIADFVADAGPPGRIEDLGRRPAS